MVELPHALDLLTLQLPDEHDSDLFLGLLNDLLLNHGLEVVHVLIVAGGPLSDMLLDLGWSFIIVRIIFLLLEAGGLSP